MSFFRNEAILFRVAREGALLSDSRRQVNSLEKPRRERMPPGSCVVLLFKCFPGQANGEPCPMGKEASTSNVVEGTMQFGKEWLSV